MTNHVFIFFQIISRSFTFTFKQPTKSLQTNKWNIKISFLSFLGLAWNMGFLPRIEVGFRAGYRHFENNRSDNYTNDSSLVYRPFAIGEQVKQTDT